MRSTAQTSTLCGSPSVQWLVSMIKQSVLWERNVRSSGEPDRIILFEALVAIRSVNGLSAVAS